MRLAAKLTLCGLAAILGACSTRTPIEVVTASGISRGYAVTTAYTGTIYTTKSLYLTGSIGPPDCTGSFNGPLPSPAVTVEMGCQAHYGGIGTGLIQDGRLVSATVRMRDGTLAHLRAAPAP